jgi:predicted kinase
LRSDVLRKRLWGADPRAPLAETAYTTEITERVFQELARCSEALLRAGYSVIADAVFREPEQRNLMAAVAGRTNAAFHGLWLEGPLEMLESRVAGRKHDASDATVAILRQQLKEIIPPSTWARFDVACSKEEAAAQIVRALWHVS